MTIVAVKLPHGLVVEHQGRTLNLNGPNEGYDPDNPAKNGALIDGENVAAGYGLTELKGDDEKAFVDWCERVTFKDKAAGKKLDEPFKALENGQILVFKTTAEAKSELKALSASIASGFEGVGEEELKRSGIERADKK